MADRSLLITLSTKAHAEVLRRMRLDGGDPSNRQALISRRASSAELGVTIVRPSKQRHNFWVIETDNIEVAFEAQDFGGYKSVRVDWNASAPTGRWTFEHDDKYVRRAIKEGVISGLTDGLAEQLPKILVAFNLVLVFGVAAMCGADSSWLAAFGAALAVTAAALVPLELLLFPGVGQASLAFYRRTARAWWFYAAWAALVLFAVLLGRNFYTSPSELQRQKQEQAQERREMNLVTESQDVQDALRSAQEIKNRKDAARTRPTSNPAQH